MSRRERDSESGSKNDAVGGCELTTVSFVKIQLYYILADRLHDLVPEGQKTESNSNATKPISPLCVLVGDI